MVFLPDSYCGEIMAGISTLGNDIRDLIRTHLVASADVSAYTSKILKGRPTKLGKQGYSRVEIMTPNTPEVSLTQSDDPIYDSTISVILTCVTRKGDTSPALVDAVKKALRTNQSAYKAKFCYNMRFISTATTEVVLDDNTTEYHTDVIVEWDFYGR